MLAAGFPWQSQGLAGPNMTWTWFSRAVCQPLLCVALGSVPIGLVLGASSLHPAVRASGQAHRLALLGALVVCLGGLAECTRALATTWMQHDFLAATAAWELRQDLLRVMLGLSLVVPLLARLVGHRPAAARGERLAFGLLAALVALTGLTTSRAGQGIAALSETPVTLATAPTCAHGRCDAARADLVASQQTRSWMVFPPALGVVEARLATESCRSCPRPAALACGRALR